MTRKKGGLTADRTPVTKQRGPGKDHADFAGNALRPRDLTEEQRAAEFELVRKRIGRVRVVDAEPDETDATRDVLLSALLGQFAEVPDVAGI